MILSRGRGVSAAAGAAIVLLIAMAATSVIYVNATQGTSDQIQALKSQISQLATSQQKINSTILSTKNLPVMDQAPTIRTVRETWYLSPSSHQDRFNPSFIVVNQGDTIHLTFIDNDTVAHTFTIGPPYDVNVNVTVPGLINDLTGDVFTTPATNQSPGVVVKGTPGNVSASYSFMAKYSGVYEFVCVYHASVGMIGYLVVLPNAAYGETTTTAVSSAPAGSTVPVTIALGASLNTSSTGFTPDVVTLVMGVNNTIQWTNNDTSPHTVTANDGSFDSGNLSPGQSYTYTFLKAGTYKYHCTYHPWMVGTVIVKAGA